MASRISVRREDIMARFGGMGFHNAESGCWRMMEGRQWDETVCKIYRELSPGFSRMSGGSPDWSRESMDDFAEYCGKMQCVTGATIYLTGSCVRYGSPEELTRYAQNVADRLEYLIREKGLTNIRMYCMSNELSLDDWGDLNFEMETFKTYHTYLYREFRRRGLPVLLLATDASPYERWETIEWAIANGMVPISGVFGGHHYVNDFDPEDLEFYKIFGKHCANVVDMLKPYERRFVLGEFGLAQAFKQGKNNVNGVKMDVCDAFYNGKEAYSALQISEMALAAMNAGVYAMALWTFTDLPNPTGLSYRLNKWGLTRWDGENHSPRDWLYAYGLLVKYLKKEGKPLTIHSEDVLLRSGGVVNDDGSFSIAIVNRHEKKTEISLALENLEAGRPLRKYVYDSNNVPRNAFGDLQDYEETLSVKGGQAHVKVPGNSVIVLTTDYREDKPAPVQNVQNDGCQITWDATEDPDHVYYRVYKGMLSGYPLDRAHQIASTVATRYEDPSGKPGLYQVRSVNRWGNV